MFMLNGEENLNSTSLNYVVEEASQAEEVSCASHLPREDDPPDTGQMRAKNTTQDLFELLERVQSARIDDQRCVLPSYFAQVSVRRTEKTASCGGYVHIKSDPQSVFGLGLCQHKTVKSGVERNGFEWFDQLAHCSHGGVKVEGETLKSEELNRVRKKVLW
ncbi:hypothetical protein RUM44_010610 [Polyplax serrata]|uniref:Uncharacterized protein n=1 Tax=Polyplax serrata TaxID=468196 RepID=A0ABR1AWD0_POLSC